MAACTDGNRETGIDFDSKCIYSCTSCDSNKSGSIVYTVTANRNMVIWKRGERSCQSWNAYSNEGRQKVN
jgi:hypothetical protein